MASRTKMKEEARARRLAEEQAAAERSRRQRRMQMLGGIVVLAVAIVVVAVIVSSGGGSSTPTGLRTDTKQRTATVNAVQALLAGIPQSGTTLGNPKAPVKITYYGDLQCPVCKDFTLQGGFPVLVSKDVKAGRAQVTYSGFETATRDPQTFQTQQLAALAAGQQGKFWQFVELFYRQQGQEGTAYVTEDYLDGLAKQVPGLNYAKWLQDRKNPGLLAQEQGQAATGQAQGINSTPTLVFVGPKGKATPSPGVLDYNQIAQSLKSVA